MFGLNTQALARTVAMGVLAMTTIWTVTLSTPPSLTVLAAPASGPQVVALQDDHAKLEKAFKVEVARLPHEEQAIERATQGASKLALLIDKLQAKGKDTTKLRAALDQYRAAVDLAKAAHNQAKSILTTHAGFDGNGAVTDAAQAKQTVEGARKAEKDCQAQLKKAVEVVRTARTGQGKK